MCSAHVKEPTIKSADLTTAKDIDIEGNPDSLANVPRVRLTGKKFYPVLEMLRFHWLPGTFEHIETNLNNF
jgi:hypothetical protein